MVCFLTFVVALQVYFGNLLQNLFGINASKNEWNYIDKIDRNIGLFYFATVGCEQKYNVLTKVGGLFKLKEYNK